MRFPVGLLSVSTRELIVDGPSGTPGLPGVAAPPGPPTAPSCGVPVLRAPDIGLSGSIMAPPAWPGVPGDPAKGVVAIMFAGPPVAAVIIAGDPAATIIAGDPAAATSTPLPFAETPPFATAVWLGGLIITGL